MRLMLSYQHAYHAGNLADVHKHAALAFVLEYMCQKDKPLCYFETHAGRALYDLSSTEARKTGEAAVGILQVGARFAPEHPYARAVQSARALAGDTAYPGSPWIARCLLRPQDRITVAERHPAEAAALRAALPGAEIVEGDGPSMALARIPPEPRRGCLLIDPPYEIKEDYAAMPKLIRALHRKWSVGVILLWYPILRDARHRAMSDALDALGCEKSVRHELHFPAAKDSHGMIGSGLFAINPPFGWDAALQQITNCVRTQSE